jgi:segregation and condensation protein A
VAALGRAVLDGLARAGVAGVIKHMPGHGRALVDSHKETPLVTASEAELAADLAPFQALAHAAIGMTGHLRFTAWDADLPATLSPFVVGEIIRKRIGFDGLLLTDDLDMEALTAPCRNARRGRRRPAATWRSTAGRKWTTWWALPRRWRRWASRLPPGSIARWGPRRRLPCRAMWRCRRTCRAARHAAGAGLTHGRWRAALADEDLWEGLPEVSGAVSADEALYLELDGWEGPLDLLLDLARRQKVDLRGFRSSNWSTSILTISTGPKLKLELAADYLVMAAWLAYLKSLLLLPRDPACSPARKNGAAPATAVAAAGRDARGGRAADGARPAGARCLCARRARRDRDGAALRAGRPACSLIQAYGQIQHRNRPVVHMVRERPVMTLEAALARISALLGTSLEWRDLRAFLPPMAITSDTDRQLARSALASSFWPRWNWPSRGGWNWCRKNALARC